MIDAFFNEDKTANLRLILDSIFDGVYIVDRKRKIIFWNSGAEEITGYSSDEVSGRRCSDNILNHIDENGNILCKGKCPLLRTLKTGKHVRMKVYPLHKSGNRFPVMTHIAPIVDKDGNTIAAVEVFRDISKEEDFRILQEKFNNLIKKYVSSATFETVMGQIQSGDSSGGRIRDLTVLYLDIAGFTSFSENNSPEEVVEMLNEVFGICHVITTEHQGDIDKFIGDAVMAIFIDPNDAVLAAEKILFEALPKINEMRIQDNKSPVNIRIGINSGNVIEGEIGTIDRKDLTVIGDVVNTASRIETACVVNSISISEATYSRLNPQNSKIFKFGEKVAVKGKKEPVSIFNYYKV